MEDLEDPEEAERKRLEEFEKFYFSMPEKERRAYFEQKRREHLDRVEKQVFDDLRLKGLQVESLDRLPYDVREMDQVQIGLLLEGIESRPDHRVMEMMIRALGMARVPFDGRPLIRIYQTMRDNCIEFAILNTISLAKVLFIEDWLEAAYLDPYLHKTLKSLGFKWKKKRGGPEKQDLG